MIKLIILLTDKLLKKLMKKLTYIGNEISSLDFLKQQARNLFARMGHLITDKLSYEGYKSDIEEIEDEEELETLIAELDDEEVKGLMREEEERYAYRHWPEDDYGDGYFSKV